MSLMSPMMGAPQPIPIPASQPQHGLLGAASSYAYPMTSGLLGAISGAGGVGPFAQRAAGLNPAVAAQQAQMSQTPQDYTSLALQLAGNPHAGPYSTAGNTVQAGPVTNPSAGSTSGGSTGSQILGGLLGALSKDPSLLKNGVSAIQGLLGGDPANGIPAGQTSTLSSLGGSNPFANPDGSSPLSSLASTPAGTLPAGMTPAVGSAPTSAELGTTSNALNPINVAPAAADAAGLSSLAAIASGVPADAAVTSALGSVAAQTAPEAAAIQAANDAALSGSAGAGAGGGAASSGLATAGAGSLAGAVAALPIMAAFGLLGSNGPDKELALDQSAQGAAQVNPRMQGFANAVSNAMSQGGTQGVDNYMASLWNNYQPTKGNGPRRSPSLSTVQR